MPDLSKGSLNASKGGGESAAVDGERGGGRGGVRDPIELVCPADGCGEDLGRVIFDRRIIAMVDLDCPKCKRPLKFIVNEVKVIRRGWPHDAPVSEKE